MSLACKSCGQAAMLRGEVIIKTCDCNAGFTASMSATCRGEGSVFPFPKTPLEKLIELLLGLMKK